MPETKTQKPYFNNYNWTGFCCLGLLHACLFFVFSVVNLPLAHDTMINFQVFSQIYSELFHHNQFPFWLPFTAQGITADLAYAFTFLPAFYLVAFLGKLFLIDDPLFLFKFGIYIEEFTLIVGLFLISSLFSTHRLTPIIVSITGILSVSWLTQIHWNFHLIYLFPLVIFFVVRFLHGKGLENMAFVLLMMTLGSIFYTHIFIAFVITTFMIFWLTLYRPKLLGLIHFSRNKVFSYTTFLATFFIAFLNIQFALNILNGMESFTPYRMPDGSIDLEVFLSYGDFVEPEKFMELIYGSPVSTDFGTYSGLFTIIFLVYCLFRVRSRAFWAFFLTSLIVFLFSVGASGFIAEVVYFVFPEMKKFRHIGYVTPVAKILLIIASSFGIDHFLTQHRTKLTNVHVLGISIISLGLIFLFIDFAHNWEYAYAVNPNLIFPFVFHWIHWGILAAFFACIVWFAKFRNANYLFGWLLLICVILSSGSQKYYTTASTPSISRPWISQWQDFSKKYSTEPVDFNQVRYRESDQKAKNLSMMGVWGSTNSLAYGSLPVDLCFPIHRADIVSSAFSQLIKSRQGGPDSIRPLINIDQVTRDNNLMRSMGCNLPKLYLTNTTVLASVEDARHFVNRSKSLYENPIVQKNCGNKCGQFTGKRISVPDNAIDILDFNSNELKARVSVPKGSDWYLVYLDSYHPRWTASVNGVLEPIYPGNLAFKVVKLPEGSHEVHFSFNGGSIWTAITVWSNLISILGLVLILAILLLRKITVAELCRSIGRLKIKSS